MGCSFTEKEICATTETRRRRTGWSAELGRNSLNHPILPNQHLLDHREYKSSGFALLYVIVIDANNVWGASQPKTVRSTIGTSGCSTLENLRHFITYHAGHVVTEHHGLD